MFVEAKQKTARTMAAENSGIPRGNRHRALRSSAAVHPHSRASITTTLIPAYHCWPATPYTA